MSLFAALTVAVGGLNAQSSAIGNVSDNLANAQTIGFKRIDTRFESLVTQSNARSNDPGGVRATPSYQNSIQGGLLQSQTSTSLAISGEGFFGVQRASVDATGATTFNDQQFYTRRGDFTLNRDGYLVNGADYYLLGYAVDSSTGEVDTSVTDPIQISALLDNPVATSSVRYAANLPASADAGEAFPTSTVQIFDSLGNPHELELTWTKIDGTNQWSLDIETDDAIPTALNRNLLFEFNGSPAGTLSPLTATYEFDEVLGGDMVFDTTGDTITLTDTTWAAQGYQVGDVITIAGTASNNSTFTITALSDEEATVAENVTNETATSYTATRNGAGIRASTASGQTGPTLSIVSPTPPDTSATVSVSLEFLGAGSQTVVLDFGDYNAATGITQFAADDLQVTSFEQNGIPRGSFQDLAIDEDGFVTLNYDNGRARTLFQIPIVQFFAPNSLQREDGGAFSRTLDSGTARFSAPGTVGAGTIVGNALEGSNVDIADEFTKMIQSQRVYSANARTISTTNAMLEEVINVVR
ncbi:MAG: flagellar hook protein FlgE [Bdellovibrionales bacterium]